MHNAGVTPDETMEQLCADAWRAVTEEKIGEWRLRAASGFTGRANSVLAVGDPGMPVRAALDQVCEFSHVHGIAPRAHVVVGSELERAIEAAGWVPDEGHQPGGLVSVLVGPLGSPIDDRVRFLDQPSPHWWELAAGSAEPEPAARHVLSTGEIGYGVAEDTAGLPTDQVAGVVRAAITGAFVHIARLEVRPEHRRRGLARSLMAASGQWAAERGARESVLQVWVGNEPAIALYEALGFREHHRYRYWIPACEDHAS